MQHTSNTSTFFEKASNVPSNVSAQVSIARVRGDVYRLSGARSPPLEHSVIHSWWTAWAWAWPRGVKIGSAVYVRGVMKDDGMEVKVDGGQRKGEEGSKGSEDGINERERIEDDE